MSSPSEGWYWLPGTRKAHYFRDTRALCGRWAYFGPGPLDPDTAISSKDDCAACGRARAKERAKEVTS